MTNANDEQATLRKFRAQRLGLDLDVKILRLRLKAGFNPSQPRVPRGSTDGGQWTDGGGGSGRSQGDRGQNGPSMFTEQSPAAGARSGGQAGIDRPRVVTAVGPRHSPQSPNIRHTVALAGGRRVVFQTEGANQTVLDTAGKPVGRAIWTPQGPISLPTVQRVSARDAQDAFEAGRQLYNRLSSASTRQQQACLAFTAKEFRPKGSILPSLSFVGMLSRADTEAVCTKLEVVQRLSDEAMEEAKLAGPYSSAAVFGTAVHTRLHRKIEKLSNPTLKSELSLLKRLDEAPLDFSAVRVDVLEDREVGPICVYDLKTGRRGLSRARAIEFAARLAHRGRPIVIIELRPYE